MSQIASNTTDTVNDLHLVEEGRKISKDADQNSDTEVTNDDHLSAEKTLHHPSRSRVMFCFAVVLCTIVLAGIGVAVGLLLPKILGDDDDDIKESTTSRNTSTPDVNVTEIDYDYVIKDVSDSRDGGFYADTRVQALQDGFTDVLQGGRVLAWPQSPEPDDSTHRVIFDLKKPQPVKQVHVAGIVLERWGLNAPVSLRLQLADTEGSTLSDRVIYITKPNAEGAWNVTFESNSGESTVTQALLDVNCPLTATTVNSLNMKCGISEVDFF